MNQFSALAKFYDRFVGADYAMITDFIDEKIRQYNPDASLVCDIGCGSGTITLSLLDKGYDMIGIDGSIDMLSEAQDKRLEHSKGDKALFLCQQLPEFELYGTVDCLVSTLDTLNYITEPNDLDRLFYWFRNYLNPNGLLIFDVNTEYKYRNLLDNQCRIYDEDDVFMAWQSRYEDELCYHDLSIFNQCGDLFERYNEEQVQRYYSVDFIKDLLQKYGFRIIQMTDDYSEEVPDDQTQRLTFVAIKES